MRTTLKARRFLYRRGFIEGFGHISARLPGTDRYMITRHSLALDARPQDVSTSLVSRYLDIHRRELVG